MEAIYVSVSGGYMHKGGVTVAELFVWGCGLFWDSGNTSVCVYVCACIFILHVCTNIQIVYTHTHINDYSTPNNIFIYYFHKKVFQ